MSASRKWAKRILGWGSLWLVFPVVALLLVGCSPGVQPVSEAVSQGQLIATVSATMGPPLVSLVGLEAVVGPEGNPSPLLHQPRDRAPQHRVEALPMKVGRYRVSFLSTRPLRKMGFRTRIGFGFTRNAGFFGPIYNLCLGWWWVNAEPVK